MFERFIAVFTGVIVGVTMIGARYDWVLYENGLSLPAASNLAPKTTIFLKLTFFMIFVGLSCAIIFIEPKNRKKEGQADATNDSL